MKTFPGTSTFVHSRLFPLVSISLLLRPITSSSGVSSTSNLTDVEKQKTRRMETFSSARLHSMHRRLGRQIELQLMDVILDGTDYSYGNQDSRDRRFQAMPPFPMTSSADGKGSKAVSCSTVALYGVLTVDCSSLGLTDAAAMVEQTLNDLDHTAYRSSSQVGALQLDQNQLTELGAKTFGRRLPNLERLVLAENLISSVNPEAFAGLNRLLILDLSNNRLSSLPVESFRHLMTVRHVSFHGNRLMSIGPEAFRRMTSLESVDLSNCHLEQVDPLAFVGCARLVAVNIAGNSLTGLSQQISFHFPTSVWNHTYNGRGNTITKVTHHVDGRNRREYLESVERGIQLDGNPWNCDCKLRWLRKKFPVPIRSAWSSMASMSAAAVAAAAQGDSSDRKWPLCDQPEVLRGVSWRYLAPEQFACPSRIVTSGKTDDVQSGGSGKPIVVRRGQNATIDCVVTGDPEPQVYWTRQFYLPVTAAATSSIGTSEQQMLQQQRRRRQQQQQYVKASRRYDWFVENGIVERHLISTVQLQTSAIRSEHAGQYRCTAINLAGRAEVVYTVIFNDSSGELDDHSSSSKWGLSSWNFGRAAIAFGSTMLAVVAVLSAFIVVHRYRRLMTSMVTVNRYRVRDAGGNGTTSRSSKFAGRRFRTATLLQHRCFRHQQRSTLSFQRQLGCSYMTRTNAWNDDVDPNGEILLMDSLTATSSMSVIASTSGKSTSGSVTYKTSVTLFPDSVPMQPSSVAGCSRGSTRTRSRCVFRLGEIPAVSARQRHLLTPIVEVPTENDADSPQQQLFVADTIDRH